MTTLDDFVNNGEVHVAASVFPVSIDINGSGRSPVRFMMLRHPNGAWWAAAWGSSSSGKPAQVLWGQVRTVFKLDIYGIDILLEDETRVLTKPSSGGCCGNRLRSWNPFGPEVILLHSPYSEVVSKMP
ncbi:hypothetical protein SEA_SIXAMA_64 [Gordonia phage Sixama]|uniref:Uncharacterized protein n=1 Tax=Gordonia phage Sixama TaxID=2653271 RepID=A0A5Q2F695_9CAUD|nr:hypothetical protein PP302_gp064 [Gordonia phage Sixama]QGF20243.1 hypothetical protein SEA_SIXAMA_64 [Gordonia phage Sixama]